MATKGVPRCVAALYGGATTKREVINSTASAVERFSCSQSSTHHNCLLHSRSSSLGPTSSCSSTLSSSSGAAARPFGRIQPWRVGDTYPSRRALKNFRAPAVVTAAAAADSAEGGGDTYDFDLITIGAGSGGVRASRIASSFGAKVAICELPFGAISSDSLGGVGGTCVLRGCVPKKILVIGSHFRRLFEESRNFGWAVDPAPTHDWSTLIKNKNKELQRLLGVYKNILSSNNVELIEGRAKVLDAHTVEIDGKPLKTKHILVSVGGRAVVPDLPGKELVITSDQALELPDKPKKVIIVGGGYIALEFAGIFHGVGSEVHVYIRQDKVLRGFDEEIRDFLGDQMAMKGITFHFGESPTAVEKLPDGNLKLVTTKGEAIADTIMFATGRKPNTTNLGLESAGVELDPKGSVIVDEYSRTNVDNIWAVGDVTNRINLTPVAIMEGTAFAKTAFNNEPTKPSHKFVPSAVFTDPPIGTVGLTEAQALEEFGDIDVYTSSFRPMKTIISGLGDKTFMKIIVDASTDKVVGVHMCGDEAPEILQGFGVAVKAGMTKAQIDSTVGIHPTAAEELVTMRSPARKLREKKHQHHH